LKKIPAFTLLFFLLSLIACTSGDNSKTNASASVNKSGSPEEVFRQWQAFMDNSEYDKAMALSTQSSQNFIEALQLLESGFQGEEEELSAAETKFLVVRCQETNDKAVCNYVIEVEEAENVIDSIFLIRQSGYWLVDIPEEALEPSGELEKLFESTKVLQ